MTSRVGRRGWLGLGLVVAVALVAVGAFLAWRDSDDQCARPVAERTDGWFCYEPDPSDGRPPPDGF